MLLCVCEKYSYNVYVLSTVSFNRVAAASRTSCSKLSQTTLVCVIPSLCHTSAGDDDLELLSLPPALKEKYIRLQTENRMLNKKILEGGDNSQVQSMLEDAQSRVNELESDSR